VRARALFQTVLTFFMLAAVAEAETSSTRTGGAQYEQAPKGAETSAPAKPIVAGTRARLLPDGTAAAPADAPPAVQEAVWAANRIVTKPYRYGGGHGSFSDSAYDCSGTVSFAFHAAGILKSPLDSSSFMGWGGAGRGEWLTVYANPGHAYAVIAGLRLDTSAAYVRISRRSSRSSRLLDKGPRWRPTGRPATGYTSRHPVGF